MSDAETAFVEVVPDFSEFRKKAHSEMTSILGPAGDSGGRAAGAGVGTGVIAGIGKLAAPIAAAFAALGIGQIVGNAIGAGINYALDGIDLASNLSETRAAIGEVFGGAASDIEAYASTANRLLGQTQQQALSAAQTFGVFAQAAGLTDKPLADFSTGLVTLSTDLASFFNTDVQTAIDAIGAGLRGESEPLRQFGVLLDDATLRQSALTLGIYDGSGALTQQQRILAAQAEIYRQTGLAQGDFARTSDGLAGQQKILAASFEDAKARLGESLLPAMTDLVTLANDELVPILDQIIDQVGPELAASLVEAAPAFADLVTEIAPLIPELVELATNLLPLLLDSLIILSPLMIDNAANTASFFGVIRDLLGFLAGDVSVQEFAKNAENAGGSAFTALYNISAGLATLLTGFNNLVIDAVNATIDAVNGVSKAVAQAVNAASSITGVSAKYSPIAKIPTYRNVAPTNYYGQHAEGAFFGAKRGGYNIDVAEGGGDEVVLPLTQRIFDGIAEGIVNAGGSSGEVKVQVVNKTGTSLKDFVEVLIQRNGMWQSVDLEGGVAP